MNYSDIVQETELNTAQQWVERTLASLVDGSGGEMTQVQCLRTSFGKLQVGRAVEGPLCLNGQVFDRGLGTHADSDLLLQFPKPAIRLAGLVGVDDNASTRTGIGRVRFSIESGQKELWRTDVRTAASPTIALDLPLDHLQELHLLSAAPESIVNAHGNWVNLEVTFADGSKEQLGHRRFFGPGPCFEFTYDGRSSRQLLGKWKLERHQPEAKKDYTLHRMTWTDPATALQCILEMKRYADFPVAEWVLRFRNAGSKPTPILEDIRSTDLVVCPGYDAVLHSWDGDHESADSYEPFIHKLADGVELHFAPEGGRPTNKAFPYFNLELPLDQSGVIFVVGWPGQWSADFLWRGQRRILAGQELTHMRLMPGEEIRTPLSVLMFWNGSLVRSQNLWRRWMFQCNVPRPHGQLPKPIRAVCMGLWQNEQDEKKHIDAYLDHGAKLTHWWMDAGWYPAKRKEWYHVGTWEVDRERFPNGIKAVSDHAHARGLELILWFDIERVTEGSWLNVNRPQFLLQAKGHTDQLVNLGDPEAWKWVVEHVDGILCKEGIDLYRQDFNMDPLEYWRQNDAPDRQGMTENRHVMGYLAFWDELHRRHPDMLIDSCASGGRRNDLETLRRALPLLRSDFHGVPKTTLIEHATGNQGHTYSLASWIPYTGTGVIYKSTYLVRSCMPQCFGLGAYNPEKPDETDWGRFRLLHEQWKQTVDFLYGDFYPLTPYSLSEEAWMGWQFHRPDLRAGMAQFFRRSRSPFWAARFSLNALANDTKFEVTDLDHPDRKIVMTGGDLMTTGLAVELPDSLESALFIYRAMDADKHG